MYRNKYWHTWKRTYKALDTNKNLELWFISEGLVLFWPLALPFKAGESHARVNHAS
jgi:hypothetical protein